MEKTKGQKSNLIRLSILAGILVFGTFGVAAGPLFARGNKPELQLANLDDSYPAAQPPVESVDATITQTQTSTVTIKPTVTIPKTFEKTVIITAGYLSIFKRPAPDIQHDYNLYIQHTGDGLYDEDGTVECFSSDCHVVPPDHKFWICDADACAQCHKVVPFPTITPPYKMPVYQKQQLIQKLGVNYASEGSELPSLFAFFKDQLLVNIKYFKNSGKGIDFNRFAGYY